MEKEDLEAFAREAAKTIKSEKDLNDFRAMLTKVRDCNKFCVTVWNNWGQSKITLAQTQ